MFEKISVEKYKLFLLLFFLYGCNINNKLKQNIDTIHLNGFVEKNMDTLSKIGQYKECINLQINHYGLVSIPMSVFELTNLARLDISSNKIKSINDKLNKLNKLSILILKSNKIDNIPAVITQLSNLEKLDLSNNPIKRLPNNFYGLKKLKWLDLSGTLINTFPSEVCKMEKIEYIDLSYNKIQTIQIIDTMRYLKKLNISYTDIKSLNKSIENLIVIEYLIIDGCHLLKFDEDLQYIGNLKTLKKLSFNDMTLEKIPPQIIKLNNTNIDTLVFNNVKINLTNEDFNFISKLKMSILGIYNTKILSDLTPLKSMSNLKKLDIWATGIKEVSLENNNIEELYIREILTQKIYLNCPSLKVLHLSNRLFGEIKNIKCDNLEEFIIGYADFATIKKNIAHIKKFKRFKKITILNAHLTENEIQDLRQLLPNIIFNL